MAAVRIGVNALYLIPGGVGGTEIYLRNLLRAVAGLDAANQYVVFTNRETGSDLLPDAPNFEWAPQAVPGAFRPARILWEQVALPFAVRRHRLDVLFNPGFTSPLACPRPCVTVFHDLQHKRHPEYFRWFELPFWRFFLWSSAHQARVLIAVSEATRGDLHRYYRLNPAKVRVVPHGVEEEFFALAAARTPVDRPYLLCVSTLHPHKNVDTLLAAFAEFHRDRPEYRLVVVGLRGFHARQVEQQVARLRLEESVALPGWVSREQLFAYYRDASGFVFPSRFEGFGMPLLEALAAGLPSACSGIEPLRSLAGGAALQFDPDSVPSIREALDRLTGDPGLRQGLAEAGPRRAREFSWRQTARLTLDALGAV